MTVQLPRRKPSENQDTFLERLIALLENIVDTVKIQGVSSKNLVPGASVQSAKVTASSTNVDVTGFSNTLVDSVNLEVLGGLPIVANSSATFVASVSGSGEAWVAIELIVKLKDSAGNLEGQGAQSHWAFVKPGATYQLSLSSLGVDSGSMPSGVANIELWAGGEKVSGSGSATIDYVEVAGYVMSANEFRR